MKKVKGIASIVFAVCLIVGVAAGCSSVGAESPGSYKNHQACFENLFDSGFETERLICEKTTTEDLPVLGELISPYEVNRYLLGSRPEGFPTKEEALQFVTDDFNRTDDYYLFTVKLKDSNTPIGQIGYTFKNQYLYVYYWLGLDYHGVGYASEAFIPLTKQVFKACEDVKYLCINCDYNNNDSFKLAKKICEATNESGDYDYSVYMRSCQFKLKSGETRDALVWSFYLKKA